METNNDGGNAFPSISNVEFEQNWITEEGMSLRDYFACHSPFGVNQALDIINGVKNRGSDTASINDIAEACGRMNYIYADAMLKERNK